MPQVEVDRKPRSKPYSTTKPTARKQRTVKKTKKKEPATEEDKESQQTPEQIKERKRVTCEKMVQGLIAKIRNGTQSIPIRYPAPAEVPEQGRPVKGMVFDEITFQRNGKPDRLSGVPLQKFKPKLAFGTENLGDADTQFLDAEKEMVVHFKWGPYQTSQSKISVVGPLTRYQIAQSIGQGLVSFFEETLPTLHCSDAKWSLGSNGGIPLENVRLESAMTWNETDWFVSLQVAIPSNRWAEASVEALDAALQAYKGNVDVVEPAEASASNAADASDIITPAFTASPSLASSPPPRTPPLQGALDAPPVLTVTPPTPGSAHLSLASASATVVPMAAAAAVPNPFTPAPLFIDNEPTPPVGTIAPCELLAPLRVPFLLRDPAFPIYAFATLPNSTAPHSGPITPNDLYPHIFGSGVEIGNQEPVVPEDDFEWLCSLDWVAAAKRDGDDSDGMQGIIDGWSGCLGNTLSNLGLEAFGMDQPEYINALLGVS